VSAHTRKTDWRLWAERGYIADAKLGLLIGVKGRPIGSPNHDGYIRAYGMGGLYGLVHRLVWESVNGEIPAGYEINHKNGNKRDNRIENLECVTPSQNVKHAYETGLKVPTMGASNPNARLSDEIIREIRRTPGPRRPIAERFGIALTTVSDIRTGKRWRHVTGGVSHGR
jgi:hypothetical protein